jgi:cysteine desulfurase/selenocysteine lyase
MKNEKTNQSKRNFLIKSATASAALLLTGACRDTNKKFKPHQIAEDANLFLKKEAIANLKNQPFSEIRNLLHFKAKVAPLNASNLSPAYSHSLATLSKYQRQLSARPDFINRRDFVQNIVDETRTNIGKILGTDPAYISFVRNTSEANMTIIRGLELKEGDEVLLWKYNHATNFRSWAYEASRKNFSIKVLNPDLYQTDTQYFVEQFTKALSPKTKVVSFSHISNTTGFRMPLKEIIGAIKTYNPDIHVHIDGAQSLGSVMLHLEKDGVDSYASSCQKYFCSPWGSGLLYVSKKVIEKVYPNVLGYDFSFEYPMKEFPTDHRRFEAYGQRDIAIYGALGETAKIYLGIGPERIEKRIKALSDYGIQAFKAKGMKVVTPDTSFSHGVVTVDLDSKIKTMAAFLGLHNQGIACAFVNSFDLLHKEADAAGAKELFRISTNFFNNEADIDHVVDFVAKVNSNPFKIVGEAIKFL